MQQRISGAFKQIVANLQHVERPVGAQLVNRLAVIGGEIPYQRILPASRKCASVPMAMGMAQG